MTTTRTKPKIVRTSPTLESEGATLPRPPKEAKADLANDPPAKPRSFQFTAAHAEEARANPHTVAFEIPHTRPGATVQVNPLDFNNPDVLLALPGDLLTVAVEMATATERAGGRSPAENDDGTINPEKAVDFLKKEATLSRQMCIMGFVDPPLVAEQADAVNGAVWVDDIHPADRRQFLFFSLNRRGEDAARLDTFPETTV